MLDRVHRILAKQLVANAKREKRDHTLVFAVGGDLAVAPARTELGQTDRVELIEMHQLAGLGPGAGTDARTRSSTSCARRPPNPAPPRHSRTSRRLRERSCDEASLDPLLQDRLPPPSPALGARPSPSCGSADLRTGSPFGSTPRTHLGQRQRRQRGSPACSQSRQWRV